MDEEEVTRIISSLFASAKEADEFEYACALLRVRGMEDFGWDPLIETQHLFADVGSLLQAPLADPAKVRLGLLLYSHLTEVDAVYEMFANLIAISMGARYTMDPFGDLYAPRSRPRYDQRPPSAKQVVERVKSTARETGLEEVADLLDWFFNAALRNAFFHSDYILFGDELRSREAWFEDENGTRRQSLKLDQVAVLINASMLFFSVFMTVFEDHRSSYREDRQVEGRILGGDAMAPLTLLADPERGLYGFRAKGPEASRTPRTFPRPGPPGGPPPVRWTHGD